MRRETSLALVLLLACASNSDAGSDLTPSGDPPPVPAVRLHKVDPGAEGRMRTFFGRVAALDTVQKSFEINGRIIEIPVREGERIAAGEVIARLDPDPLERGVERALVAFQKAERDEARLRKLVSRNVVSEVSAEDAQTNRDLASVALRDAKAALEDAVLTAPFDGIVAERLVPPFTNVEPGEPVLALHDMSEVRVKIAVPERVLAEAGSPEAIRFFVAGPRGDLLPVELAEYEAQTEGVGQSFELSLRLPELSDALLIPGVSKTVFAQIPEPASGRLVPSGAILSGPDRAFQVMVFEPSDGDLGTVSRQTVEGSSPHGTARHVHGLEDGALVVAAGAHLLAEGQTVRRYNGLVVEEE